MLICFVLSPREAGTVDPRSVAGSGSVLTIHRREGVGFFYPHIAQEISPGYFRFFAGRLTAVQLSEKLPEDHPVCCEPAEDWSFRGEEPDGSWIALKFDRARDVLSIAADPFNVQRWFYTEQNGSWYISNSLVFLNEVLPQKPGIEERGIPYMLMWGYLPCHITPLRGVLELDCGETLTVKAGKGTISRRRILPVQRRAISEGQDHPAVIAQTLIEAVGNDVRDLKTILVPLSGGIDSRFLMACALETMEPEQLSTMTFGARGSMDATIGIELAKLLGVKSIRLDGDSRPIGEIIEQNWSTAEGMYWAWPDYPVQSYNAALPSDRFVLSGYIGDPVFGSKEKGEEFERSAEGNNEALLATYLKACSQCSWEAVQPLLETNEPDPFSIARRYGSLPGTSMQEKFDHWYFGPHSTNRTHYALFAARDRAFYLTPFLDGRVLDVAFALPPSARRKRRAYFAALGHKFPALYAIPTTNNYGFPLATPKGLRVNAVRAWRAAWTKIDGLLCSRTGRILYRHPRAGNTHQREFMRAVHRKDVLAAFEEIKVLRTLRTKRLDELSAAYSQNRLHDGFLVRGLLTLQQWVRHYSPR